MVRDSILFVMVSLVMMSSDVIRAQSPVIVPLQDLNTGPLVVEPVTGGSGIDGGRVVFRGTDSEHGEEVWIVEGSVARPAAEIRPGPESSFPDGFASLGTDYFTCVADDGVTGPEVRVLTVGGGLALSGWADTDLRPGADHTAPVLLGSGNGIVWYAMDAKPYLLFIYFVCFIVLL